MVIVLINKISDKIMEPEPKLIRFLPSLAVAVSTPVIVWSIGGLETVLFTCLILCGVYYFLSSLKTDSLTHCCLADLCYFLAVLCRPEGALFWTLGYVYIFINFKRFKLVPRLKALAISIFFVTLYLSWKYYYFGDILPLTFYAKYNTFSLELLYGGLKKFFSFLMTNLNFLYLLLFFAVIPAWFRRKPEYIAYLYALVTAYFLYVIPLGPNVPMDIIYRLYVPVLPLFYLIGLFGLNELLNIIPKFQHNWKNSFLVFLIIVQIITGGYELNKVWNHDFGWKYKTGMRQFYEKSKHLEQAGQWLGTAVPRGSTIAIGDIGVIPYYSDLKVLDTYSLLDKEVIKLRKIERKYLNTPEQDIKSQAIGKYIFDQNPEIIYFQYVNYDDPRTDNYILIETPYEFFKDRLYIRKDIIQNSEVLTQMNQSRK